MGYVPFLIFHKGMAYFYVSLWRGLFYFYVALLPMLPKLLPRLNR